MLDSQSLDTRSSVEIRDLDLRFGDVEVLQKLNLDIKQGEFLVLLGSSGCGKSTLLNCIAGLLEVSDGQIFIGGRNVTWAEPSERGIGMVFQSYALYPQMTVEGNLSFGLKNARMPKEEIARRVARAAGVPWAALRAVTDGAGAAALLSFRKHYPSQGGRAADSVQGLLEALAGRSGRSLPDREPPRYPPRP